MRRATRDYLGNLCDYYISIHTLHAEGDQRGQMVFSEPRYFNPHPPCGGRHSDEISALPNWRNFNPHPPCGGRPVICCLIPTLTGISIHTLHAEGDVIVTVLSSFVIPFQSTPSMRRATLVGYLQSLLHGISIHTLHAEGDQGRTWNEYTDIIFQSTPSMRRATSLRSPKFIYSNNFNPHPPCGGRLYSVHENTKGGQFQSTPSMRRATLSKKWDSYIYSISIHTLHAEGDKS